MPEAHDAGIDVSAEEERYLKRAFRRFALPYLVIGMALAAAVVHLLGSGAVPVAQESDELQSLLVEAASLREAVATLREEVAQVAGSARQRIEALEGGVDLLRRQEDAGESTTELGSRLDHAHQRITALEARLRQMEAEAARPAAAPPASPAPASPGWTRASDPQLP